MANKFLSGINVTGTATLNTVVNAGTNTDKFLVLDASGNVDFRTALELYNDLGIGSLPAGFTSTVKHQVKAGEAINKGQAVYVTSADGTNMIVSKASNASEATSSKTMGLIESNLSQNGQGVVITEGLLAGLNTTGATNAGDPVWLGTDGNLIYGLTNKPYAPAHLVFIGIVTRINANNGEIFVKVQNGFELREIHDVDLITTTPINGHILGYNGTLWVNKTIAGWLGYTPVTNARTLTINGTSYDLSADRSWTITPNVNATNTQDYTATAGQTTFTVTGGYTVGQLAVFYNGSKLASNEFTATNGTTFVLATACQANDIVQAVVEITGGGIGGSGTANYISKWTASGVLNNSLIFDNGTNVGIGTTTLGGRLDVRAGGTSAFTYYFRNAAGNYGGGIYNTGGNNTQLYLATSAGTENVLLNTSGTSYFLGGNLAVGVNSATYRLEILAASATIGTFNTSSASGGWINFKHSTSTSFGYIGSGNQVANGASVNDLGIANDAGNIVFATGGGFAERMRITANGRVIVNSATDRAYSFQVNGDANSYAVELRQSNNNANYDLLTLTHEATSGNRRMVIFNTGGFGTVGTIISTNSSTTYNTSSDYRLKEDLRDFDGLSKVSSIKVYDFKWKIEDSRMEGVLAHELQEVIPYAVYGEKDEVDENGKPKMQGVDYSKLVPVLIKAIQEQQKQIEELKQLVK